MDNDLGPTVQIDFTLDVGAGRLDATAIVPTAEVTLTQLLPVLQNLSSNIIGSAVQIAESEGFTVSCRAGCGACCRQLVPLGIFEAELLAGWVQTLPEERQAELASRFDSALRTLNDAGIIGRMDAALSTPGSVEEKQMVVDYLRQRVACPFLEDEACSIHPIRPLICREHLVTSPPEHCYEPSKDKVRGVPIPVKLSGVIYDLGAQVAPGTRGWIPLVFLFAWMRVGGGHPGNAVSGPGPDLLYEVVKRLTTVPPVEATAG
jgi:Fe-S-cluster containining protein